MPHEHTNPFLLPPLDIASPPPFQPQSFDDPALAVDALTALYERNTAFLIDHFAELAKGAPIKSRYRAFYPQVSIETTSFGHVDSRLSYGHVTAPGVYTTTITRPQLFKYYLKQQLGAAVRSHNVPIVVVSESTTPIPLHFAFGEGAHVEASANAFVDVPLRDHVRRAGPAGHRRRDRQRHLRAAAGRALLRCRLHRAARRLFARTG